MKKVLITGASKGLGKAMAVLLSKKYDLVLHASAESNLDQTWQEVNNKERHTSLCADFSKPDEVKTFCGALKKQHPDLYAVINNAGITFDKSILYQPENEIDMMIQVNLKTPILISKTALKIFYPSQKGVIINISSCVGEIGNAFQSIYAATKGGLVSFTKSLAREVGALLENHDIRILSVSPGLISTSMTDKIPDAEKKNYLSKIPSRRFGAAEEVASLVAFLLSDEAKYINGSDIKINGGMV